MGRTSRTLHFTLAMMFCLAGARGARAAAFGKVSGLVVDPTGTPQMGAVIHLTAEAANSAFQIQLFTNQFGAFTDARVPSGLYEIRVTLAGFLPTVEHHVRILSNLNTMVKIQMTTMFASLDRLRHGPEKSTGSDDWTWTLRSSAATRPILQWSDSSATVMTAANDDPSQPREARARVELTTGSNHPGSISNMPEGPATAFAYDQRLGSLGRMMLAAQVGYTGDLPAVGVASIWRPLGDVPEGPVTELLIRQTPLGPEGLTFRGMELSQHETMQFGDRVTLHYGAEFLAARIRHTTQSVRPDADLAVRITPLLIAHVRVASEPGAEQTPDSTLDATISELDNFPVMMRHNDRPALEGGWHEEIGAERRLTQNARLEAAVFHDQSSNTPVFGRGAIGPDPNVIHEPYVEAFVYDAGEYSSSGARLAYRQKLADDLEFAAVYAYAGALAPGDGFAEELNHDALQMKYRHSLAGKLSGKINRTHSQFAVSYKWINGLALTRQDGYGENDYDLDPYLSVTFRQDLPTLARMGHWQAVAEVRNLLAQGYLAVPSAGGAILLTPACRAVRGGLSFQF